MIKEVQQTTVSSIFAINSDKIYVIPKYQREYIWGKKNWDAIFADIMENDKGYFLGSFICVNSSSIGGTRLELIDGQQRFATITLLMAALYNKLRDLLEEMDEDDKTDYANIRNSLAIKKITQKTGVKRTEYIQRIILQGQNMNDVDYSYILSEVGIISGQLSKPANHGNRRIAKAFSYFSKLIEDEISRQLLDDPDQNRISILFQIEKKFEAAVLVGIEVDTSRDAYMLFESLNHRGEPLSAIDLIKNTLIASTNDDYEADKCYDQWQRILEYVGMEDYATQERFFRQYYNAFRDELNLPYKQTKKKADKKYYFGYMATRTTLLDIYDKMIKADYKILLDDLLEKAKIYSIIVNNSTEEKEYSSACLDLARISGVPSYILLLYIISEQKRLKLKDDSIKAIVDLLINFFVRRNVTDVPSTRKIPQLFMDIIAEIKDMTGKTIINSIRKHLKDVSATDTAFEKALRGPIYDDNPEATRFLLCGIEAKHQTKEIYSDLWKRDGSNKYIWTIEHVFPEGEKIPEAWVKMIADGDRELANMYREKYVHTLGNLTITGYNQSLSNMPFEKKRDRKVKNKDVGYRNGLFLNKNIIKAKTWTIDKIESRTNRIILILMDMYSWK